MQIVRRLIAVCLVVLIAAPVARAQQSVIGKSALEQAVQERVKQEQADREAIASLLRRAEVRQIAATAGLSIEKAENDLAGGATVVITTTTIILVLLLIIIIVLLAD